MDRKEIVKALSNQFGVKPKYLGAPSFAYQFETPEGTYSIDQSGKISGPEGKEVELSSLLTDSGSRNEGIPVGSSNVSSSDEGSPDDDSVALIEPAVEIDISLDGHTVLTFRNLLNLLYSKQGLIAKAVGFIGDIIEEDFLTAIHDANIDTIEKLMTTIEELAEKSCPGISFDIEGKRMIFSFLQGEQDDERIIAYMQFVELLNNTAKILKYASAKSKETDNDKFTFRLFLIRLGMKGDAYKTARKILLEKLEGNSAFRYGSKTEKVVEEPTESAENVL